MGASDSSRAMLSRAYCAWRSPDRPGTDLEAPNVGAIEIDDFSGVVKLAVDVI